MLTEEEFFVLRKLQIRDQLGEDATCLCRTLVGQGLAVAGGKANRGVFLLTAKGRETISSERHGKGGTSWATACGYFDHLSVGEFVSLINGPHLEHYIQHQARARAIATARGVRYGAATL